LVFTYSHGDFFTTKIIIGRQTILILLRNPAGQLKLDVFAGFQYFSTRFGSISSKSFLDAGCRPDLSHAIAFVQPSHTARKQFSGQKLQTGHKLNNEGGIRKSLERVGLRSRKQFRVGDFMITLNFFYNEKLPSTSVFLLRNFYCGSVYSV